MYKLSIHVDNKFIYPPPVEEVYKFSIDDDNGFIHPLPMKRGV